MHVAHTNLNGQSRAPEPARVKKMKSMSPQELFDREMALKGFRNACKKHAAAIAEIKEVFPDYEPKFIYNSK